jgi:hypothetical protein
MTWFYILQVDGSFILVVYPPEHTNKADGMFRWCKESARCGLGIAIIIICSFITYFGPCRALRPSRAGLVAGRSLSRYPTYALDSRTLLIGLSSYPYSLSLVLYKTPTCLALAEKTIEAPRFSLLPCVPTPFGSPTRSRPSGTAGPFFRLFHLPTFPSLRTHNSGPLPDPPYSGYLHHQDKPL